MKKILVLSLISVVLLSACNKKTEEATEPIDERVIDVEETFIEENEPRVRILESVDSDLLIFTNGELRFSYPKKYQVLQSEDMRVIDVMGDNGRVSIFRESDLSEEELSNREVPQEKDHVGREVYGYDLYLYWANDEARDEVREIANSVSVLQTYRNNAHAFNVSFPQDWYFNFERNDLNCMGPYDMGTINSSDDCPDALIQIFVYGSTEEAESHLTNLKINKTQDNYDVNGHDTTRIFYIKEGQDNDGVLYITELNGKGLVFDLADTEYIEDAEKIITSVF